ncbi:MAG: cupin domain-containing protein [Myxococcota bacterium]|nr:cupin domain-containing protein [Myxococcota bacterium]
MRRVEKPWGYELIWAETPHYLGKLLFIRSGHRLSLQHHVVKDETIYVQQGRIRVVLADEEGELEEHELGVGQSLRILPGRIHRFIAVEDACVYEVSTAHPDDVVRHEDDYGRQAD